MFAILFVFHEINVFEKIPKNENIKEGTFIILREFVIHRNDYYKIYIFINDYMYFM